jgi:polygalacturonase
MTLAMKDKYNFLIGILSIGFIAFFPSCDSKSQSNSDNAQEIDALYAGLEFEMPRVIQPEFLPNATNITDFDAIGDGITKNTDAFAKAIQAVAEKGGGKVIVPRGIWYTGPIILKSNINLHLESGALIVFSKDFDDYPLIETSFEGVNTFRCLSPLSGKDLENIAITGSGIIDGSGDAWRPVKKEKLTPNHWNKLVKSGGVVSDDGKIWYPTESSRNGDSRDNFNVPDFTEKKQFEAVKDFLRPVMVSLVNCKQVLLDGPTFQNSPAWNIHPLLCENVIIRNLTVRNPWYSQNGDGLDLESCKNALVYNNNFDVGDDGICFKSGKNEDGRERGRPTENVIVTNNIVYHGHGGFTIGSEMSGGMKNIHISNCTFIGTDIGLRFKSTRGRGGVVENIFISNIDMIDIPAEAIRFNMFYEGNSPIPDEGSENNDKEKASIVPVTEETPTFRNIYMNNITVTNAEIAGFFQGLPEMHLQNVRLENSTFEAKKGITVIDGEEINFINIHLKQKEGDALILYNSKNVTMDNVLLDNEHNESIVRVMGKDTQEIRIKNSDINTSQVKMTEEVMEKEVIVN